MHNSINIFCPYFNEQLMPHYSLNFLSPTHIHRHQKKGWVKNCSSLDRNWKWVHTPCMLISWLAIHQVSQDKVSQFGKTIVTLLTCLLWMAISLFRFIRLGAWLSWLHEPCLHVHYFLEGLRNQCSSQLPTVGCKHPELVTDQTTPAYG